MPINSLHETQTLTRYPQSSRGAIDPRFSTVYETLRDIRNKLEKLTLTQAWSMRETDLYSFQRQLEKVDDARVGGNFLDAEGKPAELHAQRVSGV